jgi:hypothetical protein
MNRWAVAMAVLVAGAGVTLAEPQVDASALRAEIVRLKTQNAQLRRELRVARGELPAGVAAEAGEPVAGVDSGNSLVLTGTPVRLKTLLPRIDGMARPYLTAETTILKDDAVKRAVESLEILIKGTPLIQAVTTVRDIKMLDNGVAEVRVAELEDWNYAAPQGSALSLATLHRWLVKMSADDARAIAPGDTVTIVGRPVFTPKQSVGLFGEQKPLVLTWIKVKTGVVTLGSITMTEFKVRIGGRTFDSPYAR